MSDARTILNSLDTAIKQINGILLGDYTTDVVIGSTVKPSIAKAVYDHITPLVEEGLLSTSRYATKAALLLDNSKPVGTIATVFDDPVAANNGYYNYTASSWVFSGWNPQARVTEGLNKLIVYNKSPVTTINADANIYDTANDTLNLYTHVSGEIRALTGARSAILAVVEGENYIFDSSFSAVYLVPAFSETADTTIGRVIQPAIIEQLNSRRIKVIVPNGAKFMFFNTKLPKTTPPYTDITGDLILNRLPATVSKIGGAVLADAEARAGLLDRLEVSDLVPISEPSPSIPIEVVEGYYVVRAGANRGRINYHVDAVIAKIAVTPGSTIAVFANDHDPDVFSVGVSTRGDLIGQTTVFTTPVDVQPTSDPLVRYIPIPSGMTFLYMTLKLSGASTSFRFDIREEVYLTYDTELVLPTAYKVKGVYLRDSLAQKRLDSITYSTSPLIGKSWVAVGDSITEKNSRTNDNYHDFIASRIPDLTVYNLGQSGTGYYDRSGVADTITQTDPDIITVFWGTNDWGNQKDTNKKPLGAFLDTTTATISGCINIALTGLVTKFYKSKIAVITPLPRLTNWGANAADNSYGYSLLDLVDLLVQYANHYSLPYLDLYRNSNLPVWIPAANEYYFTAPNLSTPDGLHPNDAGHKLMADKILPFLETL